MDCSVVTAGVREQGRAIGGMSARAAAWLAWSLCVLSLTLTGLTLSFLRLSLLHPGVPINYYWLEATVIAASYAAVGAVVAPRLRQSPIGWLFCAIGLSFAVVHFSAEYAIYALLARPGSLPWGEASVWICSWVWVPASVSWCFSTCCSQMAGCPAPAGDGSTQLESSLYRREVPEYVVVVERTHQVNKGLTGI